MERRESQFSPSRSSTQPTDSETSPRVRVNKKHQVTYGLLDSYDPENRPWIECFASENSELSYSISKLPCRGSKKRAPYKSLS